MTDNPYIPHIDKGLETTFFSSTFSLSVSLIGFYMDVFFGKIEQVLELYLI